MMDANQELINRKQKCMKKVWVPPRKNEGNNNLDGQATFCVDLKKFSFTNVMESFTEVKWPKCAHGKNNVSKQNDTITQAHIIISERGYT